MNKAGLPAYEISNYAEPGQESRHNLAYWRYQDYIGIGPGAHGRISLPDGEKVATRTHKAPDVWMKQVIEKGCGAKPFDILSEKEQLEERVMMGLRLNEGIDIHCIPNETNLAFLLNNSFLKLEGDRLFVSKDKWALLDSILAKLLTTL
jgi:oxygen-independent coproporphyrinogen-3 oxidase